MGEYTGGGHGGQFAFILVIFVLLVIIGCSGFCGGGY
ncbi:YjcZ family sporulation protein [Peribacillus glennii]|uniref:YjcZ family sporulation protein n=1 Tax=Peribacillus glennii TaxID=2303991 RepID=A0A372L693_9BACI|nr:YjcZ family sporulation protein [Peribacillus glennii]RFU60520.1 YjcZ family sporulation protein [Peribacillus glennii]